MTFVVQNDQIFKVLYDFDTSKSGDQVEIATALGQFRRNLCYKWIQSIINHDGIDSLSTVISTLLNFTEHDNANVRVTSYSTIGALLVTTVLFYPRIFIKAFGNAVSGRKIIPKSSIAIINTFVFLSKFVSPVHLQEFITIPVMEHFKSDVTEFLQYLPNIIPHMKSLPLTYPQNLLRSIYFGRNISSAFSTSVYQLVCLNKKKMVPYLKNLFYEEKIVTCIASLGPVLLVDNEIFKLFGEDGQQIFADQAFADFTKENPKFIEFEYSCAVYSILLKKYKKTQYYDLITKRIQEVSQKNRPVHFARLLLQLSLSLDDIFKDKTESDSLKSAQLLALGKHVSAHYDEIDLNHTVELFARFEKTDNDVYCSFVEGFSICVNVLLRNCKGTKHINMLIKILKRTNKNWVQDLEVSNLISKIDHSIAETIIPSLLDLEEDRLLEFSLSPNTKLSETAMKSLKAISSYKTITNLLNKIMRSNWTDDFTAARRFHLLSILATEFDVDEFQDFIPIAYECIQFCESMAAISMMFNFLKHVKVTYIPRDVRDYCFNFVITSYEIFTQTLFNPPNYQGHQEIPPPSFLESYDTDIVSHPEIHHKTILGPTKSCFEFLCNIAPEVIEDTYTFFWICIYMIPIFDNAAIQKAISLNVTSIITDTGNWELIIKTFLTTSDNKVAATCCKLFAETKCQISDEVQLMIEKYLIEQRGTDPDLLFYCFVLIDRVDHEKALSTLPTLQLIIDPQIGPPLMFRLCAVLAKNVITSAVIDEFAMALLMIANNGVAEARNRVQKYLESNDFSKWCVTDKAMNEELIVFIKSLPQPYFTVNNVEGLDRDHLEFAMLHRDIIKFDGLDEHIAKNPMAFAKIKNVPYLIEQKEKFALKPIEKQQNISVCNRFVKGEFVKSVPLIISYLQNAKSPLNEDICVQIIHFAVEEHSKRLVKAILKHCLDFSVIIDYHSILISDDIFLTKEVLPLTVKLLKLKINEFPEKVMKAVHDITHATDAFAIIRCEDFQLVEALASVDPEFFNSVLTDVEEFRTKSFRVISRLLPTVDFSGLVINDVISQQLASLIALPTPKHCCVLLRFVTEAILCLRQRKLTELAYSVSALVVASLDDIVNLDAAAVFMEFRHLLFILVQVVGPLQDQLLTFINDFYSKNGSQFLYINAASLLVSTKKQPIQSLTTADFVNAVKSGIPSIMSAGIAGATHFIQTDASLVAVTFIINFVDSITPLMFDIAKNNKTTACLLPFIIRLLMNTEKFGSFHPFLMEFTSLFISFQNSPIFDSAIPLLPQLMDTYPSLMETIFNTRHTPSALIETIYDVFEGREETVYTKTFEKFSHNPSIEIGNLLIEFAQKLNRTDDLEQFLRSHADHNNLQTCVILAKILVEKYGRESAKQTLSELYPCFTDLLI